MIYSVEYTDCAVSDISEIYDYYCNTLGLEGFAFDFYESLVDGVDSLKRNPDKYPCCQSKSWKSKDLRIMPTLGSEVFYIPNTTERIIVVIRVLFPCNFLGSDNI